MLPSPQDTRPPCAKGSPPPPARAAWPVGTAGVSCILRPGLAQPVHGLWLVTQTQSERAVLQPRLDRSFWKPCCAPGQGGPALRRPVVFEEGPGEHPVVG